jgi:hypothetical protein
MATDSNQGPPEASEPADALAELRAVVVRAKKGDASVLPKLRALLDRNQALVAHYGDLAKQAEAAWVALASGSNLYMRETLARSAEARRAELTRPCASPVERLLVERVVACDLQLGYLTTAEADALGAGDGYRQLEYHARRVERAQRMLLGALGALTAYQRLVPAAVAAAVPVSAPSLTAPECERQPHAEPVVQAPAARVFVDEEPDEADTTDAERERLRVGVAA